MSCETPGCVRPLGHDPPCIDDSIREIPLTLSGLKDVLLRNHDGHPDVVFRWSGEAAQNGEPADGKIPNCTQVPLLKWGDGGPSDKGGFASVLWQARVAYVRHAHIEDKASDVELTSPTDLVEQGHAGAWEVLTDQGWKPWSPGVQFMATPGEQVKFIMRAGKTEFNMIATFQSADAGIQVNTQTMRQRPLRKVLVSPRDQAVEVFKVEPPNLPENFENLTRRPSQVGDFTEPLGSSLTILTLLLRTMSVCLVSGKWLIQQAAKLHVHPLPRRQDLPGEAFVPCESTFKDSMMAMDDEGCVYRPPCLPVVALSYGWIRQGHPDPDGWHFKLVVHLLKLFFSTCSNITDVALFWDFFSIEQVWGAGFCFVGRTPDADRRFKAALNYMQVIYAHMNVIVWRINVLPADVVPAVADRGWPHFEQAVYSSSSKPAWMLVGSLIFTFHDREEVLAVEPVGANLNDTWARWSSNRLPPCSATQFREHLSAKRFTGKGDFEKVSELYASLFNNHLSQVLVVRLLDIKWSPESAWQFGNALRSFTKMEQLHVGGSSLGSVFCDFVEGHGTVIMHPRLKVLGIYDPGIWRATESMMQFLGCCPNLEEVKMPTFGVNTDSPSWKKFAMTQKEKFVADARSVRANLKFVKITMGDRLP